MQETQLILLTEENGSAIMNAIGAKFNTACTCASTLTVTCKDYALDFCVVMQGDSFFEKQLGRIYEYFESIETQFTSAKREVLKQIRTSASMVIVNYHFDDEKQNPEALVFDIAAHLLQKFCGLILSDCGSNLLDKNFLLAFSDKGKSDRA